MKFENENIYMDSCNIEKWHKVAESGIKWHKVAFKSGKVAESGIKWHLKVAKWQKVAFEKWHKVALYFRIIETPKHFFTFTFCKAAVFSNHYINEFDWKQYYLQR